MDGMNCILHVGGNSGKLKVNDFWLGVVRDGHVHLVHETLKIGSYEFSL